jgi:hypothetical protein
MMTCRGKTVVIMLSGYMGSGKDTVGAILCQKYGFRRVAFADCLKDEVSHLYDVSRSDLDTQDGKARLHVPTGNTIRKLLIDHGQMRRGQDQDYWVKHVVRLVQASRNRRFVVTDWRFPNEFSSLNRALSEEADVHTWRVHRYLTPPLMNETETALDDFRFHRVVENVKTISDLHTSIQNHLLEIPIRGHVLLDVDDVLLEWREAFNIYAASCGYNIDDTVRKTWALTNYVNSATGVHLTEAEMTELVKAFNRSPYFGSLGEVPGARDALLHLNRLGFYTVAISSCITGRETHPEREKNLANAFPGLIGWLHCLPLGACKKAVLSRYPPSYFVDDNLRNVLAGLEAGHRCILFRLSEPTLPSGSHAASTWKEVIQIVQAA